MMPQLLVVGVCITLVSVDRFIGTTNDSEPHEVFHGVFSFCFVEEELRSMQTVV